MSIMEKAMWFLMGALFASVILMGAVVLWHDWRNRL